MSKKDIHLSIRLDKELNSKLEERNFSRGDKSRLIRGLLRRFLIRLEELERKTLDKELKENSLKGRILEVDKN